MSNGLSTDVAIPARLHVTADGARRSREGGRVAATGERRDDRDILAGTGAAFVLLFGVGVFIADMRAAYPGVSRPLAELEDYFSRSQGAVRALSVCHAFAALALLVFAAHVAGRLRAVAGSLADVALAGGAVAAAFLLFDAMFFWALAVPSVASDPTLQRALHTLSYLSGGVFLALPLGAFIGATSTVSLRTGLLPRWLGWWGVAATVESLAYGTTLATWKGAWSPGGVLVVAAAVPVLWVLVASVVLLRRGITRYPVA